MPTPQAPRSLSFRVILICLKQIVLSHALGAVAKISLCIRERNDDWVCPVNRTIFRDRSHYFGPSQVEKGAGHGFRLLASCLLHRFSTSVSGSCSQLVVDSTPLAQAPRFLRLTATAKGSGWGGGARVWVEVVRGPEPVWAWGGVEPAGEGVVDETFECLEAKAGDFLRVSSSSPSTYLLPI
jgi:hypothetical protein